jgi:hypothetical protein
MSESSGAVLYNSSLSETGIAATPLRVDPTGTTTQPVSGTITANAGTGPFPVSDNGGSLTVDATALPLPTGAATAAKQPALGTAGAPSADVISVQGISGGTALPISGSVTANIGAGPFPVTDNGSSLTVDGSVAVTQATGTNLHAVVDSGAVTASQATRTNLVGNMTVQVGGADATVTNPVPVSPGTGSSFTVAQATAANLNANVSGSVTANIGTAGTLATAAKQDTGNTSVGNIDTKTPALGQAAMAASVPVVIANNQTAVPISASALPLPTGAATETTLSAANGKLPATLGQKAMAASMAVTLASDQTALPVTGSFATTVVPNPADTTGTIAALNGVVAAAVQGWSSCAAVITGTWVGALVFEMSHDGGTTWGSGGFIGSPLTGATLPRILSYLTVNGGYQTVGMGPTTNVRIRAAAYTSGTVNVRLVFSDVSPAITSSLSQMHQNIEVLSGNSSTTNLAAGASFTGTAASTMGVGAIRVMVKADQPILVQIQQSMDATNWDVEDAMEFDVGLGDARAFQATSSFFRILVTNIGNATTTYFRLQSALVPVIEVLPRSLTPHGKLKIASQTIGWAPDPANFQDAATDRALLMDVDRNLNVRARVLTDELSFRDDFTVGELYVDLTGTSYFTNGSTVVTGVGTSFLSEVNKAMFVKISSHVDSVYVAVAEVISDTQLQLDGAYAGAHLFGNTL